jgi:HK97 family phage portal protein
MKRLTLSEATGLIIKDASGEIDGFVRSGAPIQEMFIRVSNSDAFELYHANEWLFATINRIVDDCTQTNWSIVPKDKDQKIDGKVKSRIEVVTEFLNDPNLNKESFREIREKFLRDLLIWGYGTIEKVKRQKLLREIYAIKSASIKIRTDKSGNLYEKNTYIQTSNGIVTEDSPKFDKDEIILLNILPMSSTPYGLKPIDVVANSVATDLLRANYNSNNFINGAEARGVLTVPGLSRTELKKFREYWESKFKGASNSHRTFITNSDKLSWVRIALNNKDMEFSEYGKEIRNRIFAVFKMQPFIMGIVDETTGKLNSAEQVRIYKNGALKPILNKEAYAYTKEIIEDGFGFMDLKLEFGAIDLEDAETEGRIDSDDLRNGVIVINERRAKKGMSKVPWGDTPINILPGGGQVDPSGRIVPPSRQGSGQQTQQKPKKDIVDSALSLIVKCAKERLNTDNVFNDTIMSTFTDEEKQLIYGFIQTLKICEKHFDGNQEKLATMIDMLLKEVKVSNHYRNLYLLGE